MVQSLCKTIWRFLKKIKIEQSYDLAIQLLGIYPKKPKHYLEKFHAPIAKVLKQPKFLLALRIKIS